MQRSHHLMTLSGWVKRKGNRQGLWHKRFLTISGNRLTFSKDEKGQIVDQRLELPTTAKATLVETSASPRFTIEVPGTDPILINTQRREDAMRWITAIHTVCSAQMMPSMSMEQFSIVAVVGRGFYGKVMLCQKKDSGELYAIKSIQKKRLQETGKSESVITERNILMRARHPFIVSLCFAFQTPSKFYLGLEYVPGGELFRCRDERGTIEIDDARIYIAEIGLALEFLHSIGIIYRDLKPENVLLDANGHVKLTDFGLSKVIEKAQSTSSFCGTGEYLAPEIVMQMAYSYPVDIWGLGILAYEMIIGQTPFFDENKTKMYSNIVSSEPYFPPEIDPCVSDFIGQLLTKNADERPKFSELKSHAFFDGLDWDKIVKKEYQPSFIPPVIDPFKPLNFDPQFTNEVPTDSFVQSPLDEVGNIPGFSYIGDHIAQMV